MWNTFELNVEASPFGTPCRRLLFLMRINKIIYRQRALQPHFRHTSGPLSAHFWRMQNRNRIYQTKVWRRTSAAPPVALPAHLRPESEHNKDRPNSGQHRRSPGAASPQQRLPTQPFAHCRTVALHSCKAIFSPTAVSALAHIS